jgi:hypothetical protein
MEKSLPSGQKSIGYAEYGRPPRCRSAAHCVTTSPVRARAAKHAKEALFGQGMDEVLFPFCSCFCRSLCPSVLVSKWGGTE